MYEFVEELRADLLNAGFEVPENHLRQAVESIEAGNYEAASGQMRSFVEGFFDELHRVLVGSGLTRGQARADLQARGFLSAQEGALLLAVMNVLHGEGAHAGQLEAGACVGRLFICAGIAHAALSLLPNLVTVDDVLRLAGLAAPEGFRLPTDSEMRTSCPACNHEQSLADAALRRGDSITEYVCMNGCQVILVVSRPSEGGPWEGRGYRLGDYVIRNARNVSLPIIPLDMNRPRLPERSIYIPASPAALMRRRPPE